MFSFTTILRRYLFTSILRRKDFQFTKKKPEGRHLHKNSCYQFKIDLKLIKTVLVIVHSLQIFLNFLKLLFSFFLCKFRMRWVCLFIEVIIVVKSSLINELISRPAFFNIVVKSSLFLRGNYKARVFQFRRKILVLLNFVVKLSVITSILRRNFQFTKRKPEGRLAPEQSLSIPNRFETDQNCSGDSSLPSGFLNFLKLLISFFVQV